MEYIIKGLNLLLIKLTILILNKQNLTIWYLKKHTENKNLKKTLKSYFVKNFNYKNIDAPDLLKASIKAV
jgi:hypothetical protein